MIVEQCFEFNLQNIDRNRKINLLNKYNACSNIIMFGCSSFTHQSKQISLKVKLKNN